MNVSNRKCIRHLSVKTLKASKKRNIIAVLAIALTTVLFTSLISIAFSINSSFQQSNFRQAGGYSHSTFKYLSEERYYDLKNDPLIKEQGLRRFLGMPKDMPFNKSHVEISYCEPNAAKWMFIEPKEGCLPKEGTNEAATDTNVLSLLGVEPKIGNEFTISFDVDGKPTTQTFILCGFWDYDPAIVANHVLIPESRLNEILKDLAIGPAANGDMSGSYNMDIMFSNSFNIEAKMNEIAQRHGYQTESLYDGDNYVAIGVNWGYSASQLANLFDLSALIVIIVLLLLIIFTGYLIIYNVFQISVVNDIRFYGMLKTIGTTGRQLKRIIRGQALTLSFIGIPIGLILGYMSGGFLTPLIVSHLDTIGRTKLSVSPLIFIISSIFSLVTVLVSCRRPGKMAARVSPIEALRYTEGSSLKRKCKNSSKGASIFGMAKANLGRNKTRTVITIISLTLAVVLLNLTVTFTSGFDINKYVGKRMTTDFVLGDAALFQTGGGFWGGESAVPKIITDEVTRLDGITESGYTYGQSTTIKSFISDDHYRELYMHFGVPKDEIENSLKAVERAPDGRVLFGAVTYGMDDFVLDNLTVWEGDLSKLKQPGGKYTAAVYYAGDYGDKLDYSNWANIGDIVTLRYIDEMEFFDKNTGELLDPDNIPDTVVYDTRVTKYHDVDYEVAALVAIPAALNYRYYSGDEFILNSQTYIEDSGTDDILYCTFNADDSKEAEIEKYMYELTNNIAPQLDYESKMTYTDEFNSFKNTFLILGSALSIIIGLVGILNFVNAILTGIITRRREFAILQAVGMTGEQLKIMLVYEGICYAAASIFVALALNFILAPAAAGLLESMFWFFSYKFTTSAILIVAPIFVAIGIAAPLITYRWVAKRSIVERLTEME